MTRANGETTAPHVVIVGGGFGGLECARHLADTPALVTVIDRRNFHLFQPLLYQVAGAALAPGDICEPIRGVLAEQSNARVLLAEARQVDLEGHRLLVEGAGGERWLDYDRLVIAAGLRHSYFGHDKEWAPFAPGLKDLDDALEIRRRVLLAFEEAEWTFDPVERERLLTFVIVGGGPTGVELAGTLVEIANRSIIEDFRNIDTSHTRVILVEAVDAVLPPYPEDLQQSARRQLEELGVDVRTGWMVTRIDSSGVSIKKGDEQVHIPAHTVLWAAGLRAVSLTEQMDVPKDKAGRVLVSPDLSVPGHPEVFVVGDLAAAKQEDGRPVPGVAQGAIQGGRHAARVIHREVVAADSEGVPVLPDRPPFRYRDKGSLATIGRSKAVADLPRLHLSGRLAWILWLFVHVMFLIGFRNRLVVMFQWAWSYITWERTSRLIRGTERSLLVTETWGQPALPPPHEAPQAHPERAGEIRVEGREPEPPPVPPPSGG